jgi:hypothetical protein
MKQRLGNLGVVLVLTVSLIALFIAFRSSQAPPSPFPGGLHYLCPDHEAPQGFTITYEAFGIHQKDHWGTAIPCPDCQGLNAKRGERCIRCGTYRVSERYAVGTCASCPEE